MKIPSAEAFRRLCHIFCAFLAAALLSSCASSVHTFNSKRDTTFGKKRETQNVHQEEPLPAHIRRVALLPLHQGRYEDLEMDGIEENFRQELGKLNLFEVVAVTAEDMKAYFGRPSYSSVENLPPRLLSTLHSAYGIDAVMFVELSYYRAYQPVGMGVRAKLLDGHTGELVWAADETFDSADPAVSNAARKYHQTQSVNPYPLQQTQTVLHSPTRFSKYVAHSMFSALRR